MTNPVARAKFAKWFPVPYETVEAFGDVYGFTSDDIDTVIAYINTSKIGKREKFTSYFPTAVPKEHYNLEGMDVNDVVRMLLGEVANRFSGIELLAVFMVMSLHPSMYDDVALDFSNCQFDYADGVYKRYAGTQWKGYQTVPMQVDSLVDVFGDAGWKAIIDSQLILDDWTPSARPEDVVADLPFIVAVAEHYGRSDVSAVKEYFDRDFRDFEAVQSAIDNDLDGELFEALGSEKRYRAPVPKMNINLLGNSGAGKRFAAAMYQALNPDIIVFDPKASTFHFPPAIDKKGVHS